VTPNAPKAPDPPEEDLTPGTGRSLEAGYLLMKGLLKPALAAWFDWHIDGVENLPKEGPAIVAVNHISYLDPLAVGYALDVNRRRPRFLAKAELFSAPVVGWVVRSARQIKVDRAGRFALRSLRYAEKALAEGEVVVIFPEGTTTTNLDMSPGKPKSGVARLALVTGAPVVPCATWGGQWVWTKTLGINPGPRKDVWVRFGRPVDLSAYDGRADDPLAWKEVTKVVFDEIQVTLAGLKAVKPWTAADAVPGRIKSKGVKQRIAEQAAARQAAAQAETAGREEPPPAG
jgi:1-acyl-sn-glycerol-3-phosphate acyltransferase